MREKKATAVVEKLEEDIENMEMRCSQIEEDMCKEEFLFDHKKLAEMEEKGKLLGEVSNNKLYLVFQKDGKYLDYKKHI